MCVYVYVYVCVYIYIYICMLYKMSKTTHFDDNWTSKEMNRSWTQWLKDSLRTKQKHFAYLVKRFLFLVIWVLWLSK